MQGNDVGQWCRINDVGQWCRGNDVGAMMQGQWCRGNDVGKGLQVCIAVLTINKLTDVAEGFGVNRVALMEVNQLMGVSGDMDLCRCFDGGGQGVGINGCMQIYID